MKTATKLLSEVRLLRSAVIGLVGRDSEGAYRSSFIQSALKKAAQKPTRKFADAESFLKELEAYE